MNFIKSTLLVAGLFASVSAFAAQDPAAFQAAKDANIANIQERLQVVQTHLSCVQAAADYAAIKACHKIAGASHKALDVKLKAQLADKKAMKAAAAAPAAPAPTAP
jgi:glycyl-tRNA synthetase beta subunit